MSFYRALYDFFDYIMSILGFADGFRVEIWDLQTDYQYISNYYYLLIDILCFLSIGLIFYFLSRYLFKLISFKGFKK